MVEGCWIIEVNLKAFPRCFYIGLDVSGRARKRMKGGHSGKLCFHHSSHWSIIYQAPLTGTCALQKTSKWQKAAKTRLNTAKWSSEDRRLHSQRWGNITVKYLSSSKWGLLEKNSIGKKDCCAHRGAAVVVSSRRWWEKIELRAALHHTSGLLGSRAALRTIIKGGRTERNGPVDSDLGLLRLGKWLINTKENSVPEERQDEMWEARVYLESTWIYKMCRRLVGRNLNGMQIDWIYRMLDSKAISGHWV